MSTVRGRTLSFPDMCKAHSSKGGYFVTTKLTMRVNGGLLQNTNIDTCHHDHNSRGSVDYKFHNVPLLCNLKSSIEFPSITSDNRRT